MGPLSYPILRIGRYGKGPMNSTDDPYFSTLVGPRTHCFQFVKISLIYKQIKPPLVGEHVFPLTGFVRMAAHVTFGGSGGIMSTARPELPYPCNSQAKSRDETSRRGK